MEKKELITPTQEQINKVKLLLSISNCQKIMQNMTDDEWQEHLEVMRLLSYPTTEKRLVRKSSKAHIVGRYWTLSKGCYDGVDTLDKQYVCFINDILKNIRKPTKKPVCDHAYYFYQIAELLRFEPQLQARLIHIDGMKCFEVWLEKDVEC